MEAALGGHFLLLHRQRKVYRADRPWREPRPDLAFRQSCGVDRRGLLHDSIVDPAARGRLLPLDVPWPLCRGGGADDAAKGRSLRTTRARLWLCPIGRAIRLAAHRLSDRAADAVRLREIGRASGG